MGIMQIAWMEVILDTNPIPRRLRFLLYNGFRMIKFSDKNGERNNSVYLVIMTIVKGPYQLSHSDETLRHAKSSPVPTVAIYLYLIVAPKPIRNIAHRFLSMRTRGRTQTQLKRNPLNIYFVPQILFYIFVHPFNAEEELLAFLLPNWKKKNLYSPAAEINNEQSTTRKSSTKRSETCFTDPPNVL